MNLRCRNINTVDVDVQFIHIQGTVPLSLPHLRGGCEAREKLRQEAPTRFWPHHHLCTRLKCPRSKLFQNFVFFLQRSYLIIAISFKQLKSRSKCWSLASSREGEDFLTTQFLWNLWSSPFALNMHFNRILWTLTSNQSCWAVRYVPAEERIRGRSICCSERELIEQIF